MKDELDLLVQRLDSLIDARRDFVSKREAMNEVIPGLDATPAERALYDERYKADHEAERKLFREALQFAQWAAEANPLAVWNRPTPAPDDDVVEAVATLQELKRRTSDYTGSGPKAEHYQRIHRAYDAAIAALSALQPLTAQAEEERSAIVEWLLRKADTSISDAVAGSLKMAAEAIDMGAHREQDNPPRFTAQGVDRRPELGPIPCENDPA